MPSVNTQQHVHIFDRMRGRYVDAGPADTLSKVLSWFSAGQVKIAPPADAQPQAAKAGAPVEPEQYQTGFDR
jgi:hypothetical protein